MASHHSPRHCVRGYYYYAAYARLVIQFFDGRIYRYDNFSWSEWNNITANWDQGRTMDGHWEGHFFNLADRRPTRSNQPYQRVYGFDAGWSDSRTLLANPAPGMEPPEA